MAAASPSQAVIVWRWVDSHQATGGPHLHRDGRQDDLYVMKLQRQIVRESITRNCKEFYFKFNQAIMELCHRAAAHER